MTRQTSSVRTPPAAARAKPWTLKEALPFLRRLGIYLEAAGWGLGLTGTVLSDGVSAKDIDLVVFPHTDNACRKDLQNALVAFGLTRTHTVRDVRRARRRLGSPDAKSVEIWENDRRQRIDIFILK